jgi:S1-C subfamily serine protease
VIPVFQPTVTPLQSQFSTIVRDVTNYVKPAVVQITNEQTQSVGPGQSGTVPVGVGSGVIYDSAGHILTNNHVVEGATSLVVALPDGRTFPGTLVGRDPQTDLAVVKITGTSLPVAVLGDSTTLQVGDWVVAIGNALALQGGPTVTAGVVSALDRAVQEPGSGGAAGPYLFGLIQTDAPINPGNSGGPLVNLKGEVVGINTLEATQVEAGVYAMDVGFSIAISTAKPIAQQLVARGVVVHAYMGIDYVPMDPYVALQIGVSVTNGVVVTNVVSGSPAARAGLQVNDVITAIDGQQLTTDSAFAQILSQHEPGDTLTLDVVRRNQTLTIKVTLTDAPLT